MSRFDEEKQKKRKPSDRTIAFDKFELPQDERPPHKREHTLYEEMERESEKVPAPKAKKSNKISGRKSKSAFSGFMEAVLPQPEDPGKEKFRKIFLLAMIAVLIGTLVFLGWQLISIDKGSKVNNVIAGLAGESIETNGSYSRPSYIDEPTFSIVTTQQEPSDEPEVIDTTPLVNTPLNINFDNLLEVNPDTRAWVKITGTAVNNVVVDGRDNEYYLTHDFYGNESVSGTVFASKLNTWDGKDDNTILFGHNMASGDFFSYVVHYVPNDSSSEPIAFYKVHPTIMMATPDGGSATYKIFAGIVCNTQSEYGEVFDYINKTRFATADDFNRYILDIMDRSWFFTDVDLTYGDELLTLSTCFWPLGRKIDTRWVVFARKVRPGESEEVDVTKAYRNYQPKLFDYYYERINGSWAGSVWDKKKLLSYQE